MRRVRPGVRRIRKGPSSNSTYRGPIMNTRGRRIEKSPNEAVDTASYAARSYRDMHENSIVLNSRFPTHRSSLPGAL